jgi:hypothetical protein
MLDPDLAHAGAESGVWRTNGPAGAPRSVQISVLLLRLGIKGLDSGLAIMGFEDAESPRPIPVLANLRGRMDEPTAAVHH